MKIRVLSEQQIETLSAKENQEDIKNRIILTNSNDWLKDVFRTEEVFRLSKIDIDDFEMDMSNENPDKTDFENAKRLYEGLQISESAACDGRLWLGLTFDKFYSYMKYRYNLNNNKNYYKNKWIFQDNASRKGLFRQGISMLWWYAYLTYDETSDNPFELTEFCFKHKDFLISIYSRAFSGSKDIRLGLIQALRDFELDGGDISKKEVYNRAVKYVSFLGGAYLVDSFTREEIYEKVYIELLKTDYKMEKNNIRFSLK